MSVFAADGLTIQQFNEPAGGQVVFHLHIHVIPRKNGVPLKPPASVKEDPAVLVGSGVAARGRAERRIDCRPERSAATDRLSPCRPRETRSISARTRRSTMPGRLSSSQDLSIGRSISRTKSSSVRAFCTSTVCASALKAKSTAALVSLRNQASARSVAARGAAIGRCAALSLVLVEADVGTAVDGAKLRRRA